MMIKAAGHWGSQHWGLCLEPQNQRARKGLQGYLVQPPARM